jgi:cytochrome c peroxidase
VEDTAITAPYQYDGRRASLQEQAQGAITAHSEGGQVSEKDLDRLADFQSTLFTSNRARFVAEQLAKGVPPSEIRDPDARLRLDAQERRGRELYAAACEACHGGPTKHLIVNRSVHDFAFVEVGPDGNVLFDVQPGQAPVPVFASRPDDEFLNVGFAFISYLGQIGGLPTFNASVELPRYRFRFYTDGSRSQTVTDLPPTPVTASGDLLDFTPVLDENGAPIVGPNFLPQLFSTDPGRAIITGDSHDFEAFDMPPLRGVARTAPYFHDNSAETLLDAIDLYSRFILPFFPQLSLPTIHPPEFEGGPPEALTPVQKQDLIAFLERL